jgi:hypothetical protein
MPFVEESPMPVLFILAVLAIVAVYTLYPEP